MSGLNFREVVPLAEKGFGLKCNKYFSGRMTAMLAEHGGIIEVRYYGGQDFGGTTMLTASPFSTFTKLFRIQIVVDGISYFPEFNQTRHFPFGYQSECTVGGVRMWHEFFVLEDALAHRLVILENAADATVGARVLHHSCTRKTQNGRKFSDFEIVPGDGGGLSATAVDDAIASEGEKLASDKATTYMTLASSRDLNVRSAHDGFKFYLDAAPMSGKAGDGVAFFFAFGMADAAAHKEQVARLRANICGECNALFAGYEKQISSQTAVTTLGGELMDSAMANVLPSIRALGIKDVPGAYRASQDYWVWGWDSLVHSDAMLYAGNNSIVRDMLLFYRDYSDPVKGLLHAFNLRLKPHHHMAFGAQCLYVTVLYNYWVATGDRETMKEVFSFARWIIEKALAAVSGDTGLTVGLSFYPDHPQIFGEKSDDLSTINNSLYYQALRAASVMAAELEEGDFAALCDKTAIVVRNGLEKLLFDKEKGYWMDAVAREDLTPRVNYPLYAMLWVSPFAVEPGVADLPRVRKFMRENFPFPRGLYMLPQWDTGFMADGNQLGAYYPSVDRCYWNLANRCGEANELRRLESIVSSYWAEHTYPEGLTHETDNADPTSDNPGCKQAFAAKSWYCDYLELALGLSLDSRGITFNPLANVGGLKVKQMRIRGFVLNVSVTGKGTVVQMKLNGEILSGCSKLSWAMFKAENTLEIVLSDKTDYLQAIRADELNLAVGSAGEKELVLDVEGRYSGILWFAASSCPVVRVEGKEVGVTFHRECNRALVWMQPGKHRVTASLI